MKKTTSFVVLLAFLIHFKTSFAQNNEIDSTSWGINFSYGFYLPGKDMKARFGVNSALGANIAFKNKKSWEISAGADFLFGGLVKEKNQLDSILTHNGQIIDLTGKPVDVFFFERGYSAYLAIGKYTPWLKITPYSGLYFKVRAGFIEHWIKIDAKAKNLPILNKEYLKGYDRLTNGFLLGEEIGYQFIGKGKLAKFNLGLLFQTGFTRNRRIRNFDSGKQEASSRIDILYGIKLGWSIQFGNPDQEYYYH